MAAGGLDGSGPDESGGGWGANGPGVRRGGKESRVLGLPYVLQVFAGLEADGASGRNADFLARAGVAADAALPRLYLKDPEPAQLDAFAALHGGPHRVEHRVDCHLSFDFGDVGDLRHFVDDVDLDHA